MVMGGQVREDKGRGTWAGGAVRRPPGKACCLRRSPTPSSAGVKGTVLAGQLAWPGARSGHPGCRTQELGPEAWDELPRTPEGAAELCPGTSAPAWARGMPCSCLPLHFLPCLPLPLLGGTVPPKGPGSWQVSHSIYLSREASCPFICSN